MKIRKCPHCKSKDGFVMDYSISGRGSETRDFKGNLHKASRETWDTVEQTVECVRCKKNIPTEKVKLD